MYTSYFPKAFIPYELIHVYLICANQMLHNTAEPTPQHGEFVYLCTEAQRYKNSPRCGVGSAVDIIHSAVGYLVPRYGFWFRGRDKKLCALELVPR